jgi:hypothetical protein
MDAYVRFTALVAAIVHIVPRRDTEGTKIDWFSGPAQKKVWKAFPTLWDRLRGEGSRGVSIVRTQVRLGNLPFPAFDAEARNALEVREVVRNQRTLRFQGGGGNEKVCIGQQGSLSMEVAV